MSFTANGSGGTGPWVGSYGSYSDPPPPEIALDGVYYIDHSADPDFGSYNCTLGENLKFDDQIGNDKQAGVGNASWEWSISAKDLAGNPVIYDYDFIAPLRSFYRLRCGYNIIQAGPIANTHLKYGDQFMSVAGKTWESYPGRWQYPFDPRPPHVNDYRFPNSFEGNEDIASGDPTPTGLSYQCNNRDIALIIKNLLTKIQSVPNRTPSIHLDHISTISQTTRFQLALNDNSYMSSLLTSLASNGSGFDWWIDWQRTFYMGSPFRFGNRQSPHISYYITKNTPGILNLEFDNLGPDATHLLGKGAGLGNPLSSGYGIEVAQNIWGRLDGDYDFGDVRNQDQLNNMTRRKLSIGSNPVRTFPLSLDPSQISGFWHKFRKGRAIHILVDMGRFHIIDSAHQILSYSCTVSNEGAARVDFNLDHLYHTNDTPGLPGI